MNNKKVTYLLLTVVICVWGIIFYRIFIGTGNNAITAIPPVKMRIDSVINIKKDSIILIANYKDPFLGKTSQNTMPKTEPKEEKKTNTRRTSRIKTLKWPAIKYGGIIKSQNKDNYVALMNINNKNKLMYENDIFEEVKLLKIFKDSINVTFKEEEKTIIKAK